jgi:hypothetical protein
MRTRTTLAAAALLAAGALIGWLAASDRVAEKLYAQDEVPDKARAGGTPAHWDELAKLPFPNGYPTEEARTRLMDELLFHRAVEVYLGALPVVNMIAMRDGSEAKFGGGYNVLPVWKKRMDAKCLVTTPNADVIYAMSYLDLKKDGPLVVAAPPAIQGMLTDFWQRALTDVGFAGPDKGQGGLYLLLPPDYEGAIPNGYHTFRSPTYSVFLFWRAMLTRGPDGPDTKAGVEAIERTLIYPLRENSPDRWRKMQFPDASGVAMNMMYPRDARFYDLLAKFIESEPVEATDLYLRGMMATLGIVKGKPFKPDARTRQILDKAAAVAPRMAGALAVTPEALPDRQYYTRDVKRRWVNAYAGVDDKFFSNTYLNLDARSVFFLVAYSSSPGMAANMVGAGAKYPFTFQDADGEFLAGERSYRLRLPPNPPAQLFWAVTIYSPVDGTMIDNGQPYPSINSMGKIERNADESYDIYFGPELPAGKPASNWIKTNPKQGYLVALRLYGPMKPFFDQTWVPDDVVKMR